VLTIRFIDPVFHGRRDGGEPEWPPSPLRVFQALVAAAARSPGGIAGYVPALTWLERQPEPALIAPAGTATTGCCLSVPNNAMDLVAEAWSRGNYSNSGDASPATHRTMKRVRPTRLLGGDAVHYLWPLADQLTEDNRAHIDGLGKLASHVVALGWGIDMVVGHGAALTDEEVDRLPGERWLPCGQAAGDGLRIPVPGTLEALIDRHERFLNRLGPDGAFAPPPPLTKYAAVAYRRASEPGSRPVAAFALRRLDGAGFRAFDTPGRALTVAGMMRHAAESAARNARKPDAWISTVVLGHGEAQGAGGHTPVGPRRFAYLPVPSIEGRGGGKASVVGSVRRVMLTCFMHGCAEEIAWARRTVSGHELIEEGSHRAVAVLAPIPAPETDNVLPLYTGKASCWATVTPVVLPGFDDPAHYRRRLKHGTGAAEQKELLDRLAARIDALLRKAITQAGFTKELAEHAEIEWRKVGFWPGVEHADRYGVPDHLRRFPRYHVQILWRSAQGTPVRVPGPVCLGGGRFVGLGLFAAAD